MRLAAVVTAYHPDERLAAVVEAAPATCEDVVVVDNTPASSYQSAGTALGDQRVKILRSGRNAGLGGALNAGLAALPAETEAVLLLDQDSVLPEDLVLGLAAHLDQDPTIGIVAPAPWDEANGTAYESLTAARFDDVAERDAVITSGMLIRRDVLKLVDGFREEFFIDYVDLDFCVRLRRQGVRIVQDRNLRLAHSIGDRRAHGFGRLLVQVIHYPAWRHYWIGRNGTILIRENRKALPRWSFLTLLYLVRWVAVTALFEKRRVKCVRAFLRGVADARGHRLTPAYLPQGAAYPGQD